MTAESRPMVRLVNPGPLESLYGTVPELRGVRLRSVNLSPSGPTVTLRLDLPSFPAEAPPQWAEAGMDTVQCQFQFLDVDGISLTHWAPPATADVAVEPRGARRRARVRVTGAGVALSFEAHELAKALHVSAFRIDPDGADGGPRLFLGKLDARLYASLPGTDESKFYER